MEGNGRDTTGRFAVGNPGGPGRPRRLIERDYLTTLSNAVSLEDWQAVVATALTAAKEGDARARDWLTRYLLGNEPPQLIDVAVDEARGIAPEDEIILTARYEEAEEKSNLRMDQLLGRVCGD